MQTAFTTRCVSEGRCNNSSLTHRVTNNPRLAPAAQGADGVSPSKTQKQTNFFRGISGYNGLRIVVCFGSVTRRLSSIVTNQVWLVLAKANASASQKALQFVCRFVHPNKKHPPRKPQKAIRVRATHTHRPIRSKTRLQRDHQPLDVAVFDGCFCRHFFGDCTRLASPVNLQRDQ